MKTTSTNNDLYDDLYNSDQLLLLEAIDKLYNTGSSNFDPIVNTFTNKANVTLKKLFSIEPDELDFEEAKKKIINYYGLSAFEKGEIIIPKKIAHPLVVARSTISPRNFEESLFVCSQAGKIYELDSNGILHNIADLSFYSGTGDVLPLGSPLEFPIQEYDERGLLGIEFHPNFKNNGRLFIYYSAANELKPTTKHPTGLPNTPLRNCSDLNATILCNWNEENYTHANVLEEWKYIANNEGKEGKEATIFKVRRLLSIKQPFFNHNSLDNLFYLQEENRLILFTGDGGYRDAPYLLTQKDEYPHGKAISIDIDSKIWHNFNADKPIAKFSELPSNILSLLDIEIKGIRNWSGMTTMPHFNNPNKTLKIMGQPGQDTVESVYIMENLKRFDSYKNVHLSRNIGFPAWEGSFPALQNIKNNEYTDDLGNYKCLTNYQLAVSLAIEREYPYCEYYHNDNRLPDGKGGVVIVGQQPFFGNITSIKNKLIVADWGLNSGIGFPNGSPSDGGLLWRVNLDDCLYRLHPMELVNINYDWSQDYDEKKYPLSNKAFSEEKITRPFYIGLSSNKNHDRLYLLTYNRIGSKEINGLGIIYEIIE
jgi:hypothetical protein